MTRPIDADALRERIITLRPSALRSSPRANLTKQFIDDTVAILDAAPALRCDGCKHLHEFNPPDSNRKWCDGHSRFGHWVPPLKDYPDFACSLWEAEDD